MRFSSRIARGASDDLDSAVLNSTSIRLSDIRFGLEYMCSIDGLSVIQYRLAKSKIDRAFPSFVNSGTSPARLGTLCTSRAASALPCKRAYEGWTAALQQLLCACSAFEEHPLGERIDLAWHTSSRVRDIWHVRDFDLARRLCKTRVTVSSDTWIAFNARIIKNSDSWPRVFLPRVIAFRCPDQRSQQTLF